MRYFFLFLSPFSCKIGLIRLPVYDILTRLRFMAYDVRPHHENQNTTQPDRTTKCCPKSARQDHGNQYDGMAKRRNAHRRAVARLYLRSRGTARNRPQRHSRRIGLHAPGCGSGSGRSLKVVAVGVRDDVGSCVCPLINVHYLLDNVYRLLRGSFVIAQ